MLTLKVMALGGGAFGWGLGREGGALMNGICLYQRFQRAPLALQPLKDTEERRLNQKAALTRHQNPLVP